MTGRLKKYFNKNAFQEVVLYGAGNMGELVSDAIEKVEAVSVCQITDNDRTKWNKKIGSLVVQPPSILDEITVDCIVICSF